MPFVPIDLAMTKKRHVHRCTKWDGVTRNCSPSPALGTAQFCLGGDDAGILRLCQKGPFSSSPSPFHSTEDTPFRAPLRGKLSSVAFNQSPGITPSWWNVSDCQMVIRGSLPAIWKSGNMLAKRCSWEYLPPTPTPPLPPTIALWKANSETEFLGPSQ